MMVLSFGAAAGTSRDVVMSSVSQPVEAAGLTDRAM
jgi:hypothetical protein